MSHSFLSHQVTFCRLPEDDEDAVSSVIFLIILLSLYKFWAKLIKRGRDYHVYQLSLYCCDYHGAHEAIMGLDLSLCFQSVDSRYGEAQHQNGRNSRAKHLTSWQSGSGEEEEERETERKGLEREREREWVGWEGGREEKRFSGRREREGRKGREKWRERGRTSRAELNNFLLQWDPTS